MNIAQTAEETGFDRIDVADHVWQHPIMASHPGARVDDPQDDPQEEWMAHGRRQ